MNTHSHYLCAFLQVILLDSYDMEVSRYVVVHHGSSLIRLRSDRRM